MSEDIKESNLTLLNQLQSQRGPASNYLFQRVDDNNHPSTYLYVGMSGRMEERAVKHIELIKVAINDDQNVFRVILNTVWLKI